MGRTVRIEERLMDAATAMNGCGPAYVYLMVEAWIDAGIYTIARRRFASIPS